MHAASIVSKFTQACRVTPKQPQHDDVIKWKHFPRYWPFVRGIHRSPVNYPHKGQWRKTLMFSLICVWINGIVNNSEVGDLKRYRAHYDVIVLALAISSYQVLRQFLPKSSQQGFCCEYDVWLLFCCCHHSAVCYIVKKMDHVKEHLPVWWIFNISLILRIGSLAQS